MGTVRWTVRVGRGRDLRYGDWASHCTTVALGSDIGATERLWRLRDRRGYENPAAPESCMSHLPAHADNPDQSERSGGQRRCGGDG